MNAILIVLVLLFAGDSQDPELQASVRVTLIRSTAKSVVSGTVIKVIDRDAYVLTTAQINRWQSAKIEFFYMDGDGLPKPSMKDGRIILLVENRQKGIDFAVIKVDLANRERPTYIPLADKKVRCREGQDYRAIGCSNGKEPTEHDVAYLKERDGSLVTKSVFGCFGGGMFRGGKLLGVCWGSSKDKEDLFTPHYRIINALEGSNLEFLLE